MEAPQPPAVIDIEASGFGFGSYPIEVGYVLPCGTTFCSLIRPEEEWTHWDARAETLHGISREQLFDVGRPARDIALQLNECLADTTLYSDAWGQDNCWLLRLYDAVGLWPNFRLQTIRYIISEQQLQFWQLARKQVQDELAVKRHRASSDARIIQQTYVRSWTLSHRL